MAHAALSYHASIAAPTNPLAPAGTLQGKSRKIALKRTQRTGSPRPARKPEPKPAWPAERHSGEGSASALETLQKLEKRRGAARPGDPPPEDDTAS